MRKVVERAKKIGEQENPSQREAQEQADAEEELNNLDLEDKDVLGAFVTFTFIHFKDFVSLFSDSSSLFFLELLGRAPNGQPLLEFRAAPLSRTNMYKPGLIKGVGG